MRHFFVSVARIVVCSTFVAGVVFCQSLPTVNHEISKDSAKKYIANLTNSFPESSLTVKASAFNRNVIDNILAQANCFGIRIYFARLDNDVPTLVLVGVDNNGNDLSDGIIAETTLPCPPFCDSSNSLSK